MKKIVSILLTLVVVCSLFAGCGSKTAPKPQEAAPAATTPAADTPAAATPAAAKKVKIGVTMKDLSDQFVKNIADAIQARAKELPEVDLILVDAQGDVSKQISQVENFVAQKVDVIVLNAQDSAGCGPAVDAANKANIPIIECNTLTSNDKYNVYVGSDDVDAGKIQGDFIKKLLNSKGDVAIIHGPMGQSPEIKRKEGVKAALLDTSPDIKVLAEQTANWKRDAAMALTEDWMQKFPTLNAILAQNDDMAMGALQAVQAAGKGDKITIVGVDAIPDALKAVKEGKLACTVFQDSKGQGAKSVDVALALGKGGTSPKEVMIPFQLVTKDNVDKFLGLNAK
jgi:inositol transport system substrate-binding protein